ncbi:MAG TPA: glycosyl hydrolase family 28-related protein [Candidatus Cloacimonadota bacterium]|nr:glycosyl hydrolase family 28-related protein [Candidatus Cloacimonadota bacterium]HPS39718.1 glycosyl hydrolase family 28-related protein [Candidatus Cloacimonadota bacterium]
MKKLIIFLFLFPALAFSQQYNVRQTVSGNSVVFSRGATPLDPTKTKSYNVLDYGADATGVADATTAIQAACDAAYTNSGKVVGAGTFLISDSIVIRSHADFTGATFNIDNENTSAVCFNDASANLQEKTVIFPRVIQTHAHTNGTWTGKHTGVRIINATACQFYIPYVRYFKTGILLTTYGTNGTAYNQFFIGVVVGCQIDLKLSPRTKYGWVNENTFNGGWLACYTADGTGVAGTRAILIDTTSINQINNNLFLKMSLEGNLWQYNVDCAGTYNIFLQCRWESSTPKVKYTQISAANYAYRNMVIGGFSSSDIEYTEGADCVYNNYIQDNRMFMEGSTPYLGSNIISDNSPVFSAVNSSFNKGDAYSTLYGFAAGYNYTRFKAAADAYPRLQVANGTGVMSWGSGAAAIDADIHREGVGVLHITDALHLTPTANPPGTATEGTIYMDTDHHLYVHNGSTWIQLDN